MRAVRPCIGPPLLSEHDIPCEAIRLGVPGMPPMFSNPRSADRGSPCSPKNHVPVENLGPDAVIEAVQGDVVLHERLHLDYVGDVHRVIESAAASCDGEPDDATPGAELEP